MDEAVDQIMGRSTDEKGADKANAVRKSQQKDRANLARDIEAQQKLIANINDEAAPVRAENRKVEAEVGPIKYIAAFIYGENPDANILEKAVTWVIILIVIVFDPLAVVMLLAAQMTFAWIREERELENTPRYEQDDGPLSQDQIDQLKEIAPVPEETIEPIQCYKCGTELVNAAGIGPFCPNRACDVVDSTSGKTVTLDDAVGNDPHTPGWMFDTIKETVPEVLTQEEQDAVDDTLLDEEPIPKFTKEEVAAIEQLPDAARPREAAPARGRGVMHSHLVAEADDADPTTAPSATGFGNVFPIEPNRGDVYLRIDYLPNRLFKFNGQKWIQVDKEQTDVYAYDEEYIKYLITQIDSGSYDPDLLTTIERDQIQQYLSKNV
jgi:hypothetical protein